MLSTEEIIDQLLLTPTEELSQTIDDLLQPIAPTSSQIVSEAEYRARIFHQVDSQHKVEYYASCIRVCITRLYDSMRSSSDWLKDTWVGLAKLTYDIIKPDTPIVLCYHTGDATYRKRIQNLRHNRKYLESDESANMPYRDIKLWMASTEMWLTTFDDNQINRPCEKCQPTYTIPNPSDTNQLHKWQEISKVLRIWPSNRFGKATN